MTQKHLAAKPVPKLFEDGFDWKDDPSLLNRILAEVEGIATNDLGLNLYPNDFVIVSAEEMLDAYTSHGLPHMYKHWSFGQDYARELQRYRQRGSLAYEMVINANPCLSWNMDSNTTTTMLVVMAHASCGHNHFFKNNYMFKEWTNPEGIIDYLKFARAFIANCEERYGEDRVDRILDAAHALQFPCGVFRSKEKRHFDIKREKERIRERMERMEQGIDPAYFDVLPVQPEVKKSTEAKQFLHLPEENILYFIEKHAPKLQAWEREIIRIVRMVGQYLYPNLHTKTMNEGCATFVHKYIIDKLVAEERVGPGTALEFYASHAGVVFQPMFKDIQRTFPTFNPYHLGWKMCEDIRRICENPTDEDRKWFPDWAGADWRHTLRDAWANYRDDSFVLQFLSPKLARDMRMFSIRNDDDFYEVEHIHREGDFTELRHALSNQFSFDHMFPNIHVESCNLEGSRTLVLTHRQHEGMELSEAEKSMTLMYLRTLWGYDVELNSIREIWI